MISGKVKCKKKKEFLFIGFSYLLFCRFPLTYYIAGEIAKIKTWLKNVLIAWRGTQTTDHGTRPMPSYFLRGQNMAAEVQCC